MQPAFVLASSGCLVWIQGFGLALGADTGRVASGRHVTLYGQNSRVGFYFKEAIKA